MFLYSFFFLNLITTDFEEDNTYLELLQKLCDGTLKQRELNNFIGELFKISNFYVQYRFSRVKHLGDRTFNSARDVAIDAIAPLFQRTTKDNIFVLTDEIEKWNPPIKTEKEALFFLNKIISGRVEQHISLLLKEADPFFSRILDSINYLVRSQGYVKSVYIGKMYIHQKNNVISGKVISTDEFYNLPVSLFSDRKNLLSSIFGHLLSETEYFPAIPINELVIKLKQIRSNEFYIVDSEPSNQIKVMEVEEIVNSALQFTFQKLKNSYVDKGKLDDIDFERFKLTLTSMADDLKDGGLNRGLFQYIKEHSNGLTQSEFEERYHNILEYLLRSLKNKISEEISAK